MHVTRFAVGPKSRRRLDESRNEMLAFLSTHLKKVGEHDICVVFDSEKRSNLPAEYTAYGLRVLYARDYPTADDLIEELIQSHRSPSKLTVVSSDHRIQVFAKRRRAIPVDSDVWFDRLLEQSRAAEYSADSSDSFDVTEDDEECFENPFPDGYGEDLA